MSLIHIHKRKRVYNKKLEPYPHPVKWKRYLDYLMYIIGFVGPAITIPQIYKIWFLQSAVEFSLISWISYLLGAILFVVYGIIHKAKPIIVIYIAWFIIYLVMVISIIIYG